MDNYNYINLHTKSIPIDRRHHTVLRKSNEIISTFLKHIRAFMRLFEGLQCISGLESDNGLKFEYAILCFHTRRFSMNGKWLSKRDEEVNIYIRIVILFENKVFTLFCRNVYLDLWIFNAPLRLFRRKKTFSKYVGVFLQLLTVLFYSLDHLQSAQTNYL